MRPPADRRAPCVRELERRAAEFCGAEAVAVVGCGDTAALALLVAVRDDYDRVFLDADAHDTAADAAALPERGSGR